ncbi:conserved hypothetical protein [Talaromyces stipitatus ATCC 10500]|uniref:Thioesterase domain-containing protein n=1 Tax=Talaromyces stipitatus (strain ATCC 10500 / CBS 375.48 / QM 6759 / NRRL 1006) TaxID=441959 RepID=B8MB60_TALSN|nr:uncharacterized protein TSTA_125630 [Talaromyces stipitatus ATCC 10500]EED18849.1 conserved hypothetical protein [Talaromyces stipitatus ATCC 10500]
MATTTTLATTSKNGGDVPAKLTYIEWHDHYETEEPHFVLNTPDDPPDAYAGNVTFKEGEEEIIHDIRGHEDKFTLDKQGFVFTKAPTSLSPSEFLDEEKIKEKYLPECEKYYREYFKGIDEVVFIHYRARNSITADDHNSPTGPARVAHVDLSGPEINARIRKAFPDRADFILRGRVRLVNLWRPINGPLQNWPLCVADCNSIQEKHLVATKRIRKTHQAVTRLVVHEPTLKWYYQSGMEDDTLLVLKNYDSEDGVAKYVPHCSFSLPTATASTPPLAQQMEVPCQRMKVTETNGLILPGARGVQKLKSPAEMASSSIHSIALGDKRLQMDLTPGVFWQFVPTSIDLDARGHFREYSWCDKIFEDPSLQPVLTVNQHSWSDVPSTFMWQALGLPGAITAAQSFCKGSMSPPNHSFVEGRTELWTLYCFGRAVESFLHVAHGGFLASLLDQQTGSIVITYPVSTNPRTLSSTIRYHKALITPGAVLCRAWISKVEGRKVWAKAVLEDGKGETIADMEALWIFLKPSL